MALGIGHEKLDATECLAKFKLICQSGFQKSTLNDVVLNTMARLFVKRPIYSIYNIDAFENSLKLAYSSKWQLFGLHNWDSGRLGVLPRVAVTTTVDTENWMFANYNSGDTERYLKSSVAAYKP